MPQAGRPLKARMSGIFTVGAAVSGETHGVILGDWVSRHVGTLQRSDLCCFSVLRCVACNGIQNTTSR